MRHLDSFADISNDVIAAVIDKWVKGERNREIMKRRLIDHITYERIADEFDMSPRYIKTLIYKLEMIVYKHLGV